jgi:hypothetical protein
MEVTMPLPLLLWCAAAISYQILGSIFGSMIYAGLIPGLHIASTYKTGTIAPGCFGPGPEVTNGELFWWEVSVFASV